jgi:histidinol-phosphate phosphatase family protein
MVVVSSEGAEDSPLRPEEVQIPPTVPDALAMLTQAGYGLAIVSNQPAAAKGKTTRENLDKVHARVLEQIQSKGGRILSSHICYHRSEDQCNCRKPRVALLEEAFRQNPGFAQDKSWMVGDRVTDVLAGHSFGVKTAMLAKKENDAARRLKQENITPTLWANDLMDFCRQILKS